jgi:hypothetical protein
MEEPTFDLRRLILELFPGTPPELWPLGELHYFRDAERRVWIEEEPLRLVMEPIEEGGGRAPAVCELCHRHLSRSAVEFVRYQVGERHFRYLCICKETQECARYALPHRLREVLLRSIISS